jgi:hypothetical protein
MTFFENLIVESFFQRYLKSTAASYVRVMISTAKLFPDFDTAPPAKREAFLTAAEALAQRGIIKLMWYKHRKHEALKCMECIDRDALLRLLGKPFPRTVIKNIKGELVSIISPTNVP